MTLFTCRVFGIVLDCEQRVLLIQRSVDYLPGSNDHIGWEFCGGGLEEGETPEQAIIREYLEEVGIAIETEKLLAVRTGMRNGKPLLNIGYVCRLVSGKVILTSEHRTHEWVTVAELAKRDLGPFGNMDKEKFLKQL